MSDTSAVWLSPEEVGRLLGVPRNRVLSWYRQGILPGVKLGRAIRFRRGVVSDLLDRLETKRASK